MKNEQVDQANTSPEEEKMEKNTTPEPMEMDGEKTDESTDNKSQEKDWKLECEALNDKYLRLYSEFENFRKRTQKERVDWIKSAGEEVITDLLPVLDDFERAIKTNEETSDLEGLKEGFKLIHNKLKNTLEQKGVAEMNSMGTAFDTDMHEAVTNIQVEKKSQRGKVMDVLEKGYLLNEKVIRYAKVVVGQ